ncbi:MAG: OmpA family protein [bacterium]|nr:OmpA family protein [bacterium]
MKKLFCLLLLTLISATSHSQNVKFDKANFPGKKDELKDALRKLDQGIELFMMGRREFEEQKRAFVSEHKYLPVSLHDYQKAGYRSFVSAKPYLLEANRFNPKNADLNYMLGFIYLFSDPLNPETITYLQMAADLEGEINPDINYWLAWAYHLNAKWDKAIAYYKLYLGGLALKAKANAVAMEDVSKKISECGVGAVLSAKPERVFVDNLGPAINTSFPEYGPSISTDEETIYFTSRRSNSVGGERDISDNGYYEDLYSSMKLEGKWQPAKALSKNVNTEDHDAVAGLSPDGSKLYVYRFTSSDGGDLYESILFGLDWEPPVRMNKYINTRYHESTVSLSFDGKRLFYVSKKPAGFGDSDIYFCDMDVNGEWGHSTNIGPAINTKYGEEAVFMHPDGMTMYFSSKGHGTMGGYDIFKTTLINDKWQTPVNLGYPINGPDDDVFFVVSGSGNHAYFSSTKEGGMGDYDLYKITFLGSEKQPMLNTQDQLISLRANPVSNLKAEEAVEVRSAKVTILKGLVQDKKSGKPLEATVDLIDNEKNVVLASFKSNSITGKYLVTLPSGKNYGISVKSPGYLFHSENFLLPEAADFQEFNQDVALEKVEVGSSVVLRNIFFDSDKYEIKSESANELERLVKFLKDNSSTGIEIASFTDSQGTEEYNIKLSNERSKSVVNYLTSKGIEASRLTGKGYGESKPISTNDTEAGRQKNRRTEFKILSK